MRLFPWTLFLAHLGLVLAGKGEKRRKEKANRYIKFEDCGMDPDRPVHILNVTVTPRVIRYPGRIKLSADMLVVRSLPITLSADVIISKYIWGNYMKVPCLKNMGSCHYKQLCEYLDAYYGRRCPKKLRRQRFPCYCPFESNEYSVRELRFDVPSFDGIWSMWIEGKYEVMIRLYDDSNNDEMGCLKFRFNIREKNNRKHRRHRRHKRTLQIHPT